MLSVFKEINNSIIMLQGVDTSIVLFRLSLPLVNSGEHALSYIPKNIY